MVLYKRRGSRGFDSRRGKFFFSEDHRITGGSRGFDSRRAQKKKYFGTVQPVHLGYVQLLFPTFSVQQICLGYVHYLLTIFLVEQFFEWGHILH